MARLLLTLVNSEVILRLKNYRSWSDHGNENVEIVIFFAHIFVKSG